MRERGEVEQRVWKRRRGRQRLDWKAKDREENRERGTEEMGEGYDPISEWAAEWGK